MNLAVFCKTEFGEYTGVFLSQNFKALSRSNWFCIGQSLCRTLSKGFLYIEIRFYWINFMVPLTSIYRELAV